MENLYMVYEISTGEIVSTYIGEFDGEWPNLTEDRAYISTPIDSVQQIMLDAYEDPELYFINEGAVFVKVDADDIKLRREQAQNAPTTDQKVTDLQASNIILNNSNKLLSKQVEGLISYLSDVGVI